MLLRAPRGLDGSQAQSNRASAGSSVRTDDPADAACAARA
jgi:hypothetical protein